MAEFEDFLKDVLNIKTLKEMEFKKIRIADKTIYFIYRNKCRIRNNSLISYDLSPVSFIMEIGGDFYYYNLNGEKMDENIIRKFVDEFY